MQQKIKGHKNIILHPFPINIPILQKNIVELCDFYHTKLKYMAMRGMLM
jgi:hypothetical protein